MLPEFLSCPRFILPGFPTCQLSYSGLRTKTGEEVKGRKFSGKKHCNEGGVEEGREVERGGEGKDMCWSEATCRLPNGHQRIVTGHPDGPISHRIRHILRV